MDSLNTEILIGAVFDWLHSSIGARMAKQIAMVVFSDFSIKFCQQYRGRFEFAKIFKTFPLPKHAEKCLRQAFDNKSSTYVKALFLRDG